MSEKKSPAGEPVYKITLSTGKVVLLREMKIKYQEQATMLAAKKAGDSELSASAAMQSELLKILLVQVDGRVPSVVERENLDNLFTYPEYLQISRAIQKVCGLDGGKDFLDKFELEIASSGE
jgi:hypothetical protein